MGSSASPVSSAPVVDAVAWTHVRNGRLLCVRTRGRTLFYLPGGKREPGESDADAVSRESAEEVAVRLRRDTLAPFAVVEEEADGYPAGTRVRLSCFTAEHDGEPVPRNEIAELAWFGRADRERTAPAVRRVMDELHARGLLAD
ncbi:MAG: NUDIX domain-containing protein [Nocardiopsaceae bacterium]|nr:NUDIX domain-containing protein [Nocardiopsaceae bacterium]